MKIFIPGPVGVNRQVMKAMLKPIIGHRSPEYSALQKKVTENLQKLMFTNNPILLSTSSGSGLMEGSIRSLTEKKAIVFSVGAFGDRWHLLARKNSINCDLFKIDPGKALKPEQVDQILKTNKYDVATITHNETSTGVMHNLANFSPIFKKYPNIVWLVDCVSSLGGTKIEVDKLGIDVCITSSQKALALPPGLSICSLSEKAIKRIKKNGERGWYLDLLTMYNAYLFKKFQTPATPVLPLIYALDKQLEIIFKEGLEERFAKHEKLARTVRAWAKEKFDLFAEEGSESSTVTVIKNTKNIPIAPMVEELKNKGYWITNGFEELKEKTFRIGHMGDITISDTKKVLKLIDNYVNCYRN